MQEIFGVGPCLGGACQTTDLSDLFKAGSIPAAAPVDAPEPAGVVLMVAGLAVLGMVGLRRRNVDTSVDAAR
jgi:hypothetical protein